MSNTFAGRCGKVLKPDTQPALLQFIRSAAEERQIFRVQRSSIDFGSLSLAQAETILYSMIFRSLGYSQFSSEFERLAELRPCNQVQLILKEKDCMQSKPEILKDWVGNLQITFWRPFHPTYQSFADQIGLIGNVDLEKGNAITTGKQKPFRPVNHPIRRLTGFYWHLWNTREDGLLKAWLRLFQTAGVILEDSKKCRTRILEKLNALFHAPDTEELVWLMLPTSTEPMTNRQNLIGQQRQMVIFINAVVPFFLSWARFNKDRKLEKTLFGLFLVLPPEGDNFKILEMKKAFTKGDALKLPKSLSVYQGLIQLHDDYCGPAQGNCDACSLPAVLESL